EQRTREDDRDDKGNLAAHHDSLGSHTQLNCDDLMLGLAAPTNRPGWRRTQLSLSARLQHFEEPSALHPVGPCADGPLVVPDRLPAPAADITVHVPGVKPARRQKKLQFLALL